MRALIQRVSQAKVTVDGKITGQIGAGLLVLLGVKEGDTQEDADYLSRRLPAFRIFNDAEGKMNLSVEDISGEILVVSQFTLHADTRKGNRPSYVHAADPAIAEELYERVVANLRTALGPARVATGRFGAMMEVALTNDGPVTVMLQSKSELTES
ncbi:MAG: D-tyrosyl-tRNA(Tyr) deacylase [Ectothiorhodospiraceae bacterium]|nr:D-tyrosyl-tRNA(Tyr) deacylase [Ectothiorhodospiraceae bacterium]